MRLRPYQETCVGQVLAKWQQHKRLLAVLPTGAGKTIIFSHIADRMPGRSLIIAHREELLNQAIAKLESATGIRASLERADAVADRDAKVVVGSIQTLMRRHDQWQPNHFDQIIIDECFVRGTMIGSVPIEEIMPGMKVTGWNGRELTQETVVRLFRKPARKLVTIRFSCGRTVTCTPNHPFATPSGEWIQAGDLTQGMMVATIPSDENMCRLSDRNLIQNSKKDLRKSRVQIETQQDYDRKFIQETWRTDNSVQEDQWNAPPGGSGKGIGRFEGHEMEAPGSWRKWARSIPYPATVGMCFGLGYGGSSQDREAKGNWVSNVLQAGYRKHKTEDRNRGGRIFPQCSDKKGSGFKEDGAIGFTWVESVEVHERGGPGRFAEVCPDGLVYNFETTGSHTYTAEGIIVHNCHHVAADSYQSVLRHFADAKILGVTATPDRADQKSLGDHFDDIAFEITLPELIKGGYLSPIRVRVCDVSINLSDVAIRGGDFDAVASGDALEPVLSRIIDQIQIHGKKKTLVFLPLIGTSKQMQAMMVARGINARHVDGTSENRQETLEWFRTSTQAVLCNAMLLTEGYDEPSIDTIVCLRPTKSRALYTQIVGRGTRICEGKGQLLILDFLWMTGRHRLVRPTSLFVEGEVAEIADKLTSKQGEFDLESAVQEARAERERKLAEELNKKKRFAGRMIDPLEWGMATADETVVDYEATMRWHAEPITEKQASLLASYGFDPRKVDNRGHASVLIDSVISRGRRELATPKQVRLLVRMGHKYAARYSKKQASELIDKICKKSSSPATPVSPVVSHA